LRGRRRIEKLAMTRSTPFLRRCLGALVLAVGWSMTVTAQTTPDPVLSPDAVTPDPALSPGAVPNAPALAPDQTNPAPVLQPGAVAPDPALSPGAVPNSPALTPDQTNPPPVPPPDPSDSLAPLPPIFQDSNQ